MKTIIKFTLILIATAVSTSIFGQVSQDDLTSWGLKVLSSELNRKGNYSVANAISGLSRVFEVSSERRYQKDLARIMTSLNLPNGVYAISGGNIATVPDGYIKQDGQWFSLTEIENRTLLMIGDNALYEIPVNLLMFNNKNSWYHVDRNKIGENQAFLFDNGELRTLNDGWYQENGEWKNINANNYKFRPDLPYGLYISSGWKDINDDYKMSINEIVNLNKDTYNIGKEMLTAELNVTEVANNVIFTSWRNGKLIGTSVINLKSEGYSGTWTGPVADPTESMDFLDRIFIDVKKNGAGTYKVIAIIPDKGFETYERTFKVIYEP